MELHLQEFTDLLQSIAEAGEGIPAKLQVAKWLGSLPDSKDLLVTTLEQQPRDRLMLDLVTLSVVISSNQRKHNQVVVSIGGHSNFHMLQTETVLVARTNRVFFYLFRAVP